ncbi:fumarylacetoacetate hydrolase family protein [Roseomonas sp. BN140053]|uniref:fumarylacetoacetate hydrolase family protein n=1 Tax=Roseomonas sp. BN140053 TaxID=3391898 RepID=UPI0039E73FEF
MKLVSYRAGGAESFGRVDGSGILDLGSRLGGGYPDLRSVLSPAMLDRIRGIEGKPDHALAEVELLPVVTNPPKIFCAGVNYLTHLQETGRPLPKNPMIFTRFANSQVGAEQPMLRPPESEQFDYEGELAVVIGTGGRRIPKARAFEHVAGYSCYNDGTLRDWQRHTVQFIPGKNFAHTGAFGPWLVTADELTDPAAQTLTTRLNGEVMQHAPISDLMFDIPALIEYCSTFSELVQGDVIVTGTTGGVGAFRTPPVWMKAGDTVEVEISGIGILRNPIRDEVVA